MVAASRPFFRLRPTDRVPLAAMRDAHRVLCCGPLVAAAYARSTSTRTKSPPAPAPAPAPAPRQPGITTRVDLLTSWENPPPHTSTSTSPSSSPDDATRYAANIQQRLARWGDFKHWLSTQYGLPRGAPLRCQAYTTPSCGALARFDLHGLRLTGACWGRAVAAASRTGLLMVVVRTGGVEGGADVDGDGDVD